MSLYEFGRALCYGILKILFDIKVEGGENIVKGQNYIVSCNHKSNLDPPTLGISLPFKVNYMAKEELFRNKIFGSLLRKIGVFPVKRGTNDIGAIRSSLKILNNGANLAMFPEGGRSKIKGVLKRGKYGVIMISLKSKTPVLPVGINGEYKFRSKIVVKIGKPIDLSEYYDKKIDAEYMQGLTDKKLMTTIASLAGAKTYENRNS